MDSNKYIGGWWWWLCHWVDDDDYVVVVDNDTDDDIDDDVTLKLTRAINYCCWYNNDDGDVNYCFIV